MGFFLKGGAHAPVAPPLATALPYDTLCKLNLIGKSDLLLNSRLAPQP